MAGCGKDIQVMIPSGAFNYKEIPMKCGNTGLSGNPELCDECSEIHEGRNWRQEAEAMGETWEADY